MREPYITIRISADRNHNSRGKNCILSDKPDDYIVVRLTQDKSFDTKGSLDIRICYSLILREVRAPSALSTKLNEKHVLFKA